MSLHSSHDSTASPHSTTHHDCLLWVGQAYPTVLDFLNEARTRGCCRKVPFWPAWAQRGSTRIFLAHHDGSHAPDRGVVFGYFTLAGVDVVLQTQDCDKLEEILDTWRGADGDIEPDDPSLSEAWLHGAERMIDFWRELAPDHALPFMRKGEEGMKDLMPILLDLFVASPNGNGCGPCVLPIPEWRTRLEKPRFSLVDGLRTVPGGSDRPSFYFVDSLARRVDRYFDKLIEMEISQAQAEGRAASRQEAIGELAALASTTDEKGRPSGLPLYDEAVEAAREYLLRHARKRSDLRSFEHRCGTMVRFSPPYPFYKSMPNAAFRGLVQIDGDDLLRQVELTSRRRSGSHEVQLPYIVGASDKNTSKRKEELIVEMSTELKISKSFSERVLDWLPEMMADELRSRRVIRLPNIGTFRLGGRPATEDPDGEPEEDVEYQPARAFTREFGEIEFKASRALRPRDNVDR